MVWVQIIGSYFAQTFYKHCGCGSLNHNNPLDKNWMGWRRSVRSCGRKNLRKYLCALWESRVLVLGGQVNHKTGRTNQQVKWPSKDSHVIGSQYVTTHIQVHCDVQSLTIITRELAVPLIVWGFSPHFFKTCFWGSHISRLRHISAIITRLCPSTGGFICPF